MINVKTSPYNALGIGSTDDTAAINKAIAAANASGESLYFPTGTYKVTGLNAITHVGIRVKGDGRRSTVIAMADPINNTMTVSGQFVTVEDMSFSPSVFRTGGYEIAVAAGGFQNLIRNVYMEWGYNGISIISVSEVIIENVQLRYMTGTIGLYFGGTSSARSAGLRIRGFLCDNPYPVGVFNANLKTWATSTSYANGDIFKINSWIFQVTTAGTSGGSAPAAPTNTNWYYTSVANGTMQVRAICNENLIWMVQDSYADSIGASQVALIDGNVGFKMLDSANTSTSHPYWAYFWDLEVDHPYAAGVDCAGGLGLHMDGCWVGSVFKGNGIQFGTDWLGESTIQDTRVLGNGQHGILMNAASTMKVDNCFVCNNSINERGTFNGITVAADLGQFTITNNSVGLLPPFTSSNQGYGIYVVNGTSDYYIISGNLGGTAPAYNVYGTVYDGGTGTNKSVTGNV